jgi:hypothetical protein
MRTLPAIALILAGTLTGSLALSDTADARRSGYHHRYGQPRYYHQPRYYGPSPFYYQAPRYSRQQICEERAQAEDPTGLYAGYPCWAREAFGRSPGHR